MNLRGLGDPLNPRAVAPATPPAERDTVRFLCSLDDVNVQDTICRTVHSLERLKPNNAILRTLEIHLHNFYHYKRDDNSQRKFIEGVPIWVIYLRNVD
ncbi:unnamed protein product [Leptosia nina]|uniref:Uncharacterized protein n=1 Tax=Leptosia nina TaxID=320188 RepID=A0AAV1J935_9NEOP